MLQQERQHLLLGLLREQEGVAAQVLINLGLKLEEVREEVLNLLGHGIEGSEGGERNHWGIAAKRRGRASEFPSLSEMTNSFTLIGTLVDSLDSISKDLVSKIR